MEHRIRNTAFAGLLALATAFCLAATPLQASAQVTIGFTIGQAPPPLPYYTQPALSEPGQVWEPGYWAWGPAGYYWVPGTWVTPPSANLYWTPGYWDYSNGGYAWNTGYWAPQVGYYGGINYGYGYYGTGFNGGYWRNNAFYYNTAVAAVNPHVIRRVYVNRAGIPVAVRTRYSFNGPGGVIRRPTARELIVMRGHHIVATPVQVAHARFAAQNHELLYTVNRGRPATLAVVRPIRTVRDMPHYAAVTTHDKTVINKTVVHNNTTINRSKNTENAKTRTTTTTRSHKTTRQNTPTHARATHPPRAAAATHNAPSRNVENSKQRSTTSARMHENARQNAPTHAQAPHPERTKSPKKG